jgi:hypothetical protein
MWPCCMCQRRMTCAGDSPRAAAIAVIVWSVRGLPLCPRGLWASTASPLRLVAARGGVGEVRVQLELVDSRHDPGLGDDAVQMGGLEGR